MGAPKSVSILWAQSGVEQRVAIERALKDAAEEAVRCMALTTPCVQRRVETGERVWEPARGVASAQFVHHTARATIDMFVPLEDVIGDGVRPRPDRGPRSANDPRARDGVSRRRNSATA